jgi:hypothetical protein
MDKYVWYGQFWVSRDRTLQIADSYCERLKAGFGLADAGEADFAAEDGHGFKERRRVLASADGDADGLKHRPGL